MDGVEYSDEPEIEQCATNLTDSFMKFLGYLQCKSNISHTNIQNIVESMQVF